MSQPSEPLLPVEPERPSQFKLRLLVGGVGLAALGIVVVLIVARRSATSPEDPATSLSSGRSGLRTSKTESGKPRIDDPRDDVEERRAKELYDAAVAFEREEPAEYEKRVARWREVVTQFPTSSWARKADEKRRTTAASLQAFLDREFESTRKDAQALSAASHFLDAIDALRSYKAAQTRELLKRRADVEIAVIENAARLAFNETAAKAKDLAARDDYAAAIALFDSLARSATPEAAARCQTALTQLQAAAAAQAQNAQSRKGDAARRAFRETVAPRLLGFVRARQYDEALKELSAAAGLAANAAVKDEIAAERASIADASSFWDAFLKALRARTGQDATILLSDGRRMTGKISRIQPDRIVIDIGEGSADAPFDKIHADLLVGWTLGKALPAEDAVTYVKAALFFFCEGRDDLAKIYLATARELNGPADEAEKVFREGFLRAAMSLKK